MWGEGLLDVAWLLQVSLIAAKMSLVCLKEVTCAGPLQFYMLTKDI
jgi:hypothetical protein